MRSLLVLGFVLVLGSLANAQTCEPDEQLHDPKAIEKALGESEEVARVATTTGGRYAALCRAASYAFKLAEPKGERSSELAKKGVELSDTARKVVPDRVEAHYRYAICLGIYLRENKLSGITKVDDLIAAAERAAALDERYDRGGPHRILALLYAEAPRYVGPGDHDKARKHLKRLLEIAGDDEENKLVAVRVHYEIGDKDRARRLLTSVNPDAAPDEATRHDLRAERDQLKKDLDD